VTRSNPKALERFMVHTPMRQGWSGGRTARTGALSGFTHVELRRIGNAPAGQRLPVGV